MKKIILILMCSLLLVGCGKSEEKKEMLYNSLEKAYISIYATDGIGLAVIDTEVKEENGKKWYMVGISKYSTLGSLTSLANDVYEEDLAEKINKVVNQKYKEFDGKVYTTGEGGCLLDYKLDDELKENIKKDIKVKHVGINKITFEYKGKKYKAEKQDDEYIFTEKIFECPKED